MQRIHLCALFVCTLLACTLCACVACAATCSWEQSDTAVHPTGLLAHTATVTGRNKIMVRGDDTDEHLVAAHYAAQHDVMT
jgi:hypothetical protein